ncbi:MAG: hypothetical protein ACR2MT_12950 [Aurantibacter sp.]
MKLLSFIACFLTLCLVSPDLSEIRKNYPLANDSKEVTQRMYKALAEVTKEDRAITVAYKGGITTIMAKHAKGIKEKKTFFREGVSLLEHAVSEEGNNIEIRCIRLGVQENSPKFLRYRGNIEADKQFILENFSSQTSQEIKNFVKGYVQHSAAFSSEEKQLF